MVAPGGEVIAVEAHPATYRLLCMNVAQSRLGNVRALNFAAGDAEGELAFTDFAAHESNFGQVSGNVLPGGLVVPMAPLDRLLPWVGSSGVRLLKLNIEGAGCPARRS